MFFSDEAAVQEPSISDKGGSSATKPLCKSHLAATGAAVQRRSRCVKAILQRHGPLFSDEAAVRKAILQRHGLLFSDRAAVQMPSISDKAAVRKATH